MSLTVKDSAGSTQTMKTTLDGSSQHVAHHHVDTSALPTGAATEATLAAIDTALASIATESTLNFLYDLFNTGAPLITTQGNQLHDGPLGGSFYPVTMGGRASAAAPTAVSADGDSVAAWFLRNGAQMVGIVDGSGSQITSFGGGTQYTEGDVDATITGNALMYETAANTLAVVGETQPLPVFVDFINNTVDVNVVSGSAAGTEYTEGDIDASITGTAIMYEGFGDDLFAVGESTPLPVNIKTAVQLGVYSTIGVDDQNFNSGDSLWGMGAVRTDTMATLTQADGDWNPLRTDSQGALRVNVNLTTINGHAVQEPFNGAIYASILDGTGNNYLSAGNSTNSTGSGIYPAAMLAQFDDTTPNVPTENLFANLRMSSRRELYVQLRDAAGNERGLNIDASGLIGVTDGGGALTVDNGGTFAVQAAQSGTWNVGTVTTLTSITNAVTVSQATASNLNAQVVGNAAAAGADSGNPVKIGGVGRTANPTAVTNGQRVNASFDDLGRQVVVVGQVRDLITDATTTIASSSSETTILAAAASTFHDLTLLVLTNATATAVSCTIKDGTAGTTRMIVDLAANGGAVIPFPRPLKAAANNTNWTCTLSSAAVTVHIFAQAEKNV